MILRLAALGAVAALFACGSSSNQAARDVAIGDAQNGLSVPVQVGDVVTVSLGSTAWTFDALPASSILRLDAEPSVSAAPFGQCPPGVGCGTTAARYTALRPGAAVITASRVSCGEAMRCVGPAGAYRVTIAVS
ncbi:MAG: hypothetical protein ACHQ0J_07665 [Candidatus Dormibacterales bacterium]